MSHRTFVTFVLLLSIITPYALLSIATPEAFDYVLGIATFFQILMVFLSLLANKSIFEPLDKIEKEREDLKTSHEANIKLYSFLAQRAFSKNVISYDEFKDLIKNKTGKPNEYTK